MEWRLCNGARCKDGYMGVTASNEKTVVWNHQRAGDLKRYTKHTSPYRLEIVIIDSYQVQLSHMSFVK
jgi:predicted GIY-YIG superfamily endonuclease